eukprot:15456616-Alexandrium_andersonii.AAC.1
MKVLPITEPLVANHGAGSSVLQWFLSSLVAQSRAASDLVAKLDLVNRYQASRRCRVGAARLVSLLAHACLPAPRAVWTSVVDGKA